MRFTILLTQTCFHPAHTSTPNGAYNARCHYRRKALLKHIAIASCQVKVKKGNKTIQRLFSTISLFLIPICVLYSWLCPTVPIHLRSGNIHMHLLKYTKTLFSMTIYRNISDYTLKCVEQRHFPFRVDIFSNENILIQRYIYIYIYIYMCAMDI